MQCQSLASLTLMLANDFLSFLPRCFFFLLVFLSLQIIILISSEEEKKERKNRPTEGKKERPSVNHSLILLFPNVTSSFHGWNGSRQNRARKKNRRRSRNKFLFLNIELLTPKETTSKILFL